MSSYAYGSEYVKCPYYIRGTAQSLTCEGPMNAKTLEEPDARTSSLMIKFITREDKNYYKETYCDDMVNCENCFYYRAAAAKYEE